LFHWPTNFGPLSAFLFIITAKLFLWVGEETQMVCCQPAGGLLCSAPAKLLLNVSLILIGPDGCGGARLCQPCARRHQQPLFHFVFAGRLIIVFCVGFSGSQRADLEQRARHAN